MPSFFSCHCHTPFSTPDALRVLVDGLSRLGSARLAPARNTPGIIHAIFFLLLRRSRSLDTCTHPLLEKNASSRTQTSSWLWTHGCSNSRKVLESYATVDSPQAPNSSSYALFSSLSFVLAQRSKAEGGDWLLFSSPFLSLSKKETNERTKPTLARPPTALVRVQ